MTPEYILKMLRQRYGLTEEDESQDLELDKLPPMEKLRECVGWKLGDPHWADVIIELAKDCEAIDA